MPKIAPKYPCSQMDFISAAKTAWQNFLLYVIVFSNFKALYKDSTAANAIKALDDSKKMPDVKQRNEKSETARKGLLGLNESCTDLFQRLKLYIDTAYSEDVRQIKYEAAGQQYYDGAMNNDWESTMMLMNAVTEFIEGHEVDLMANDNMPATFKNGAVDAETGFNELYENYKVFAETGVATAAKIKALNACYQTLNNMLNDGKRLFKKEEEIQQLFVFSSILAKINSAKAGIAGLVTDELTDVAIVNATMTVKYENEPAFTLQINADGSFNEELKGGKATVIVMAPNYEVATKVLEIPTGTTVRMDVKLKKAA